MRGRASILVGVLLAGLAGLEGAGAAEEEHPLVADLVGADPARRTAAVRALRAARDPSAIQPLVRALPAADEQAQYLGVYVLDAYLDEHSRSAFRALLASGVPYLRLCGALALHEPGARSMEKAIRDSLSDGDLEDSTARLMLLRLRAVRPPEDEGLREAVRSFLTPDRSSEILCQAVLVAHHLKDHGGVAEMSGLLLHARPGVRAVAAAFLTCGGHREHAGALVRGLRSDRLSRTEFWALRDLLEDAEHVDQSIRDAVVSRLSTERDSVLLAGLIGLVAHLECWKAAPSLRELTGHEDAGVARAAARALARQAHVEISTHVAWALSAEEIGTLVLRVQQRDRIGLEAWLTDRRPVLRLAAADTLRRMDDLRGLPALVTVLESEDPALRAESARVLGGFRVPAAVEPLLRCLADEDAGVRNSALASLQAVLETVFPYRRIDLVSTGFRPGGPASTRSAALARIRAWWDEHRDAAW